MKKKNEEKDIHTEDRGNIIKFPKSPPPSDSSGEEDVESGEGLQFYFTPDWDTEGDDPEDSKA